MIGSWNVYTPSALADAVPVFVAASMRIAPSRFRFLTPDERKFWTGARATPP
jgi:hypothetical protein